MSRQKSADKPLVRVVLILILFGFLSTIVIPLLILKVFPKLDLYLEAISILFIFTLILLRKKLADKPLVRIVLISTLLGFLSNIAIFMDIAILTDFIILGPHGETLFFLFIFTLIPLLLYRSGKKATANITPMTKNQRQLLSSAILLFVFLSGVSGSIWYYENHICMDGHMAHPPYPAWHTYLDATWVIALISTSILSTYMKKPMAPVFAYFSTVILIVRFVFKSAGGGLFPFPL